MEKAVRSGMAKYGRKAKEKVEKAVRKYQEGKLTAGPKGPKVKRRTQAIAIGLSEARRAGGRVPPRAKKKKSER